MSGETVLALVGLGANLGAPVDQLEAAMDALEALATTPSAMRRSALWASAPVDCPPGSPDFVNAVVALPVAPGTDPEALLARLLDLEQAAGRARSVRNAPRSLDLDLLLFGEHVLATPRLTLPHPRGHLRAFVLLPAAAVAPDQSWPGTGRPIAELAADVPGRDGVRRLA